MKTNDVLLDYKTNHIIEQLHKLGFYDTKGLSYKDLVHKLAVVRVKVDSPHSGWF